MKLWTHWVIACYVSAFAALLALATFIGFIIMIMGCSDPPPVPDEGTPWPTGFTTVPSLRSESVSEATQRPVVVDTVWVRVPLIRTVSERQWSIVIPDSVAGCLIRYNYETTELELKGRGE